MANRPPVPPEIKRALVDEAGGKCANPGCATFITDIHHIQEWHVYHAHDPEHMIAICPGCHAQVHRGSFRITDEEVYAWKKIERPAKTAFAHLYVQPGGSPALLVGHVLVNGEAGGGLSYFRASHGTRLRTNVGDHGTLHLELELFDYRGEMLLEIIAGNHVRFKVDDAIKVREHTGTIEVWTPFAEPYVPDWLRREITKYDADLIVDGMVLLAGFSVFMPSVVKLRGVWPTSDWAAVVINDTDFIPYDRFRLGQAPSRVTGALDNPSTITFADAPNLESFVTQLMGMMNNAFLARLFHSTTSEAIFFVDGSIAVINNDRTISASRGGDESAANMFKRYTTVRGQLGEYELVYADGSITMLGTHDGRPPRGQEIPVLVPRKR